MAKLAYDIILKPVITEKSMEMLTQGKYTFKVAKDSNKIEIAKAVEALFPGVKVAKVNTVNCRNEENGQKRRLHTRLEESCCNSR